MAFFRISFGGSNQKFSPFFNIWGRQLASKSTQPWQFGSARWAQGMQMASSNARLGA